MKVQSKCQSDYAQTFCTISDILCDLCLTGGLFYYDIASVTCQVFFLQFFIKRNGVVCLI